MQISNSKTRETSNLKLIVLSALFTALITVSTSFIKIPTLLGYVHAGDSMIYLGASVLPGPFGIISASLGGGLADLLAGYPHWVLPTAIIKAFNALPFVLIRYYLKSKNKDDRIINVPNLLMLIPTSFVTVFGYFIAHLIMYDWSSALAGLTTEWLQPLAGALIYIALGIGLDGIKLKTNVLKEVKR